MVFTRTLPIIIVIKLHDHISVSGGDHSPFLGLPKHFLRGHTQKLKEKRNCWCLCKTREFKQFLSEAVKCNTILKLGTLYQVNQIKKILKGEGDTISQIPPRPLESANLKMMKITMHKSLNTRVWHDKENKKWK